MKEWQKCESCHFWKQGDQTPRGTPTGNIGNCTYFLHGGDPDRTHGRLRVQAPYWVQNTLHRTISWEGDGCDTWQENGDE